MVTEGSEFDGRQSTVTFFWLQRDSLAQRVSRGMKRASATFFSTAMSRPERWMEEGHFPPLKNITSLSVHKNVSKLQAFVCILLCNVQYCTVLHVKKKSKVWSKHTVISKMHTFTKMLASESNIEKGNILDFVNCNFYWLQPQSIYVYDWVRSETYPLTS